MRKILSFEAARVAPEWSAIARRKDVPTDGGRIDSYRALFDRAHRLFIADATPRGIVEEIDDVVFSAIVQDNGCLDEESPVRAVFEQADRRFLFAATIGARIVGKIADAFRAADAPLVCTAWPVCRGLPRAKLKTLLRHPGVLDGRNLCDPAVVRAAGFDYRSVGRA